MKLFIIKKDSIELYKYCLQQNTSFDYGALAIDGDMLVVVNSILLEDCDPRRFIKSLIYRSFDYNTCSDY